MRATEITVHWSPLPEQYINGLLLGYRVYYAFSPYNISSVNVTCTSPNTTWVTLTGLKEAQRYVIAVLAFTSKGEGPYSLASITTG